MRISILSTIAAAAFTAFALPTVSAQSVNPSVFFCNLVSTSPTTATLTVGTSVAASQALQYKQCQTVLLPAGTAAGSQLPISVSLGSASTDAAATGTFTLNSVNAANILFAIPSTSAAAALAQPAQGTDAQLSPETANVFYGQYASGYTGPVDFYEDGNLTASNVAFNTAVPVRSRAPFTSGPDVDIRAAGSQDGVALGFTVPQLPASSRQSMIFALVGRATNAGDRPLEVFYTFTQDGVDAASTTASSSTGVAATGAAASSSAASVSSSPSDVVSSSSGAAADVSSTGDSDTTSVIPGPSIGITLDIPSSSTGAVDASSAAPGTGGAVDSTSGADASSAAVATTSTGADDGSDQGGAAVTTASTGASATDSSSASADASSASTDSSNPLNPFNIGANAGAGGQQCPGGFIQAGNTVVCSSAKSIQIATSIAVASIVASIALIL